MVLTLLRSHRSVWLLLPHPEAQKADFEKQSSALEEEGGKAGALPAWLADPAPEEPAFPRFRRGI